MQLQCYSAVGAAARLYAQDMATPPRPRLLRLLTPAAVLQIAALALHQLPVATCARAARGLSPRIECTSLARASLGPNVSVLSATLTNDTGGGAGAGPGAPRSTLWTASDGTGTCTFEDGVQVGQAGDVVASIMGLTDRDKCCTGLRIQHWPCRTRALGTGYGRAR